MNHNTRLPQRALPSPSHRHRGEKTLGVRPAAFYAPLRSPSSPGVSVRGLVIASGMVLAMLLTFALGPPLETLSAVVTLILAAVLVTLPPRRRSPANLPIVLPELRTDRQGQHTHEP